MEPTPGVHPSAVIGPGAIIEPGAHIGPLVSIGAGVRVGAGTSIGAGSVIGDYVVIGEKCTLHPNVTLYREVTLGREVVLHSGCVIGADGFGYVLTDGIYENFPQIGRVEIGDRVEIGANSCVDRAALGVTSIGDGTKLDQPGARGPQLPYRRNVVVAAQTGFSGRRGGGRLRGDRRTGGGGRQGADRIAGGGGLGKRRADVEDRARGPARVGHSGPSAEGTPGTVGGAEPAGQAEEKGEGAISGAGTHLLPTFFPLQRLDNADTRLWIHRQAEAHGLRGVAINQTAVLELGGVEGHGFGIPAVIDFEQASCAERTAGDRRLQLRAGCRHSS